jgi:hypothetical protein
MTRVIRFNSKKNLESKRWRGSRQKLNLLLLKFNLMFFTSVITYKLKQSYDKEQRLAISNVTIDYNCILETNVYWNGKFQAFICNL